MHSRVSAFANISVMKTVMIMETSDTNAPAGEKARSDSDFSSKDGPEEPSLDDQEDNGPSSKRKRSVSEEKREERRAANRRSAMESRQRRKLLIEELQQSIAGLTQENKDLRGVNEGLRYELQSVMLENRHLRMLAGHTYPAPAGALFPGAGRGTAWIPSIPTGRPPMPGMDGPSSYPSGVGGSELSSPPTPVSKDGSGVTSES